MRPDCLRGVIAAAALLAAAAAPAKNVDLSTVPARDEIQLTIYNSEDLTLVRERRVVSFKRGVNGLQFSWANTLIDPTSVELRFPGGEDRLALLDTTFPHEKPQMLYWNVESELDGEALVEISYFTSGISWSADYQVVAAADEGALRIESFVRVHNRSGEAYPEAQVRVVVGTINLVEKIAQLANVGMAEVEQLEAPRRDELRLRAAKSMMVMQDAAAEAPAAKEIIKEGLSEYFIYTIEGTETIPDGWSKRLRSFAARDVPFDVVYRYRPREYGDRLVRLYVLDNDEASGLGTTPLPDGRVDVFRENGRGGLSYLATRAVRYVPVGDRIEIDLGPDPRVLFELEHLAAWRDELWLKLARGNVYRRVGDGTMLFERNARIAGWNAHALYAQRVRNFSGRPITVEVRREFAGDVEFRSRLGATRHDYRTVDFSAEVPAGETRDLRFEVVSREGRNAKQQRVALVDAEPRMPER